MRFPFNCKSLIARALCKICCFVWKCKNFTTVLVFGQLKNLLQCFIQIQSCFCSLLHHLPVHIRLKALSVFPSPLTSPPFEAVYSAYQQPFFGFVHSFFKYFYPFIYLLARFSQFSKCLIYFLPHASRFTEYFRGC